MEENWDNGVFETEEEVEAALDSFIKEIGQEIAKDDGRTSIINIQRIQHMQLCYKIIRFLTNGMSASVSYKLHEPYQSMGSISIEGDGLVFDNAKWFARIAEFANSMDVYPLTKKAVRITFTFHGLTNSVE